MQNTLVRALGLRAVHSCKAKIPYRRVPCFAEGASWEQRYLAYKTIGYIVYKCKQDIFHMTQNSEESIIKVCVCMYGFICLTLRTIF